MSEGCETIVCRSRLLTLSATRKVPRHGCPYFGTSKAEMAFRMCNLTSPLMYFSNQKFCLHIISCQERSSDTVRRRWLSFYEGFSASTPSSGSFAAAMRANCDIAIVSRARLPPAVRL